MFQAGVRLLCQVNIAVGRHTVERAREDRDCGPGCHSRTGERAPGQSQ